MTLYLCLGKFGAFFSDQIWVSVKDVNASVLRVRLFIT